MSISQHPQAACDGILDRIVRFIFLLALIVLLGSASLARAQTSGDRPLPSSPRVASASLVVVTTIKPIYALAAAVLGDVAKPELLIEGAGSPHTYALRPSQVRRLNEANAVVMVSDELETFMIKVAASLPKAVRVVRLQDAPSLTRLSVREGGLFEHDEHDHAHAGGHAHGSGTFDAHLWLDPENGKAMLIYLADVLGGLAPEHKADFERNARAYAERLDALQRTIAEELRPVAAKPFLVFHDAYQYFERRFGLTAIGSITLNPEVQPGARRLGALRRKIEAGGAVCVFAEPQFEPKLVTSLIEGTKVRRGTLDPIGAALAPEPDAYEKLLRNLADGLRGCLAASS